MSDNLSLDQVNTVLDRFALRPRQVHTSWDPAQSLRQTLLSAMPCAQRRFEPHTRDQFEHCCEFPVGNPHSGVVKFRNPKTGLCNFSPSEAKPLGPLCEYLHFSAVTVNKPAAEVKRVLELVAEWAGSCDGDILARLPPWALEAVQWWAITVLHMVGRFDQLPAGPLGSAITALRQRYKLDRADLYFEIHILLWQVVGHLPPSCSPAERKALQILVCQAAKDEAAKLCGPNKKTHIPWQSKAGKQRAGHQPGKAYEANSLAEQHVAPHMPIGSEVGKGWTPGAGLGVAVPGLMGMGANVADAPLLREAEEGNDAVQAVGDYQAGLLQASAAGAFPQAFWHNASADGHLATLQPTTDLHCQPAECHFATHPGAEHGVSGPDDDGTAMWPSMPGEPPAHPELIPSLPFDVPSHAAGGAGVSAAPGVGSNPFAAMPAMHSGHPVPMTDPLLRPGPTCLPRRRLAASATATEARATPAAACTRAGKLPLGAPPGPPSGFQKSACRRSMRHTVTSGGLGSAWQSAAQPGRSAAIPRGPSKRPSQCIGAPAAIPRVLKKRAKHGHAQELPEFLPPNEHGLSASADPDLAAMYRGWQAPCSSHDQGLDERLSLDLLNVPSSSSLTLPQAQVCI